MTAVVPPGPLTILVSIHSPFAAWNIPEAHVERLRREFPRHTFLHATTEARALELIESVEVVFTSELRPAHLERGRRLQWIHSPAAGVGSMLFPAMVQSPVIITNSRGISADTIAEHVVAVTLAMFRKLPAAVRAQDARRWVQDAMLAAPPIRQLRGSHVLIVGLGSIGRAAAARMSALGAHVTGVRRHASDAGPAGVERVVGPERLLEMLALADVVVIAAPQTRETRGMFGVAAFGAMRPDALVVNVSRGKLVEERSLVEALESGRIGGAALDVFEHEPLEGDSPLWSLPNVLVTPHMSGFRPDHWDAVTDLFVANLKRCELGQPLLNPVDKAAGY